MKRYSTLKTKTPLRAKKPWNPTRKPLAVRTSLKSHKPMKKLGRVGKANIEANKRIKQSALAEVDFCEIGKLGWPEFFDCMNTWPLQNVHRHKRAYYKGDAALLSDYQQVVKGCQVCHNTIEHDRELTEKVFLALRGEPVAESVKESTVY